MRKKNSPVYSIILAVHLAMFIFAFTAFEACANQDPKTEMEAKKIFQTLRAQTKSSPSGEIQINQSAMLQAEQQLAQLGERIIPILCKAAQSSDDMEKLVALNTIPFLLANSDIAEREIVPLLEIALENQSARNMALIYIEQIQYAKDRRLLLRHLKRYLNDDDAFVKVFAQRILDNIDKDREEKFHIQTKQDNPEIAELLKNLKSGNEEMNPWKPLVIRNPETKHIAVVPQIIIRKVGSGGGGARPTYIDAAISLAETKDPSAESGLLDILRTGSVPHQCAAAYALSLKENLSDIAIKELTRTLSGSPEELTAHAAMALAQSGEKASSAINPLIDIISSPRSDEARIAAIVTLGEIGITSSSIISALESASMAPNAENVKLVARTVLEQIK